ncbi:MAG: hypothetical protein M3N98_10675 [Actinomycetota bacterium]|nr:hypothetical protein [Actinomycetota bacterium]
MSTVEQTTRDRLTVTTGREISAVAAEHLAAVDDLIQQLQTAATGYRRRPLDWGDVASLRWMRDHLSVVCRGFSTAESAAELSRAARQVATEVRTAPSPARL